jgi:hypothetical protein
MASGCEHAGDVPPWWPHEPLAETHLCADESIQSESKESTRSAIMIQAAVERHMEPLSDCYQELLERNGDAMGVLEVHFTASPEGEVENLCVSRKSTFVDGPAVSCMLQELEKVRFASAKHDAAVVYAIEWKRNIEPAPYGSTNAYEIRQGERRPGWNASGL